MNYLFWLVLLLVSPLAAANELASATVPFDWSALLSALFGEHGATVAAWLSVILVIWSQVRQLIPARWMAKLPSWLITVLELLAANKGQASNQPANDPKHLKQTT